MKKLILLFLILTSTQTYGQNANQQVNQAANKWLDAMMNLEFELAKGLSTHATSNYIHEFEKSWLMDTEDGSKQDLPKEVLSYKILEEQTNVDETKANLKVKFTVLEEPNIPDFDLSFQMVKLNGTWLMDLDIDQINRSIEDLDDELVRQEMENDYKNYGEFGEDASTVVEAVGEAMDEAFDSDEEQYVAFEVGNREISKTSKEQFDALHAVARTADVQHEDALLATPEVLEVADKWLSAYYTFDMKTALEYSDDDTREFLGMIIDMVKEVPLFDSILTIIKETKIEIDPNSIVVLPTMAKLNYIVTLSTITDIEPLYRSVYLQNVTGKWLVRYSWMDALAEVQDDYQNEDYDYEETTYDEDDVEFKPAGAAIEKVTE